jgi:hypothetical protein
VNRDYAQMGFGEYQVVLEIALPGFPILAEISVADEILLSKTIRLEAV